MKLINTYDAVSFGRRYCDVDLLPILQHPDSLHMAPLYPILPFSDYQRAYLSSPHPKTQHALMKRAAPLLARQSWRDFAGAESIAGAETIADSTMPFYAAIEPLHATAVTAPGLNLDTRFRDLRSTSPMKSLLNCGKFTRARLATIPDITRLVRGSILVTLRPPAGSQICQASLRPRLGLRSCVRALEGKAMKATILRKGATLCSHEFCSQEPPRYGDERYVDRLDGSA